jgi:hypothetical protein
MSPKAAIPVQFTRRWIYSIEFWNDKPSRDWAVSRSEGELKDQIKAKFPDGYKTDWRQRIVSFQRLTTDESECGTLPCAVEQADLVFVQWIVAVTPS